ncbi:phosphatidylinositol transfer protein SFH5 [Corynascus novoguineensis]|uniref:Phosphatidylinositol transfer protein SFH5 n=1 Tax=Corynascus novoguineensis TaxID=1126955 RepID=A0AAN7CML4_9PEZI|nr:phosphatidylinositol transfer protein SFH5 [Corynascus novoguineensis]
MQRDYAPPKGGATSQAAQATEPTNTASAAPAAEAPTAPTVPATTTTTTTTTAEAIASAPPSDDKKEPTAETPKYLNANDGDLGKAKDQLTKTLEWRAKTKPLELVNKVFSKAKFDGLGYTRTFADTPFSLSRFLEWRVALIELALQELDLRSATKEIIADYDPYKIFQSSSVKAASIETIKVFAQNYPELFKEKFFVNVPAVIGFFYTFIKLFVVPKTLKKFYLMSNGQNLAAEFGESKVAKLGEKLPANYGGKGAKLEEQGKGLVLE